MPSSPSELFQLSKDLAALNGSETWQRCVVSRAYYASLHATNATFPRRESDVRIDGESSHAEIIGRAVVYGKSLSPGRTYASQIAQALPRLRRLRNFADYELAATLSQREYGEVLLRVERVLQQCAEVVRLREMATEPSHVAPQTDQVIACSKPEAAAHDREKASKPTLIRIK